MEKLLNKMVKYKENARNFTNVHLATLPGTKSIPTGEKRQKFNNKGKALAYSTEVKIELIGEYQQGKELVDSISDIITFKECLKLGGVLLTILTCSVIVLILML